MRPSSATVVLPSKQVGARLVALRRERNLSQKDLGALVGVSRVAVGHWERGESGITQESLDALVNELGIDVGELTAPDEDLRVVIGRVEGKLERLAAALGVDLEAEPEPLDQVRDYARSIIAGLAAAAGIDEASPPTSEPGPDQGPAAHPAPPARSRRRS